MSNTLARRFCPGRQCPEHLCRHWWQKSLGEGVILILFLLAASVGFFGLLTRPVQSASAATVVSTTPAHKVLPLATARPRCPAVNKNPWCYNFSRGTPIYKPSRTFCRYFKCVSDFWRVSRGYVVECRDGKYSHAGGLKKACAYARGVWRTLHQRRLMHSL